MQWRALVFSGHMQIRFYFKRKSLKMHTDTRSSLEWNIYISNYTSHDLIWANWYLDLFGNCLFFVWNNQNIVRRHFKKKTYKQQQNHHQRMSASFIYWKIHFDICCCQKKPHTKKTIYKRQNFNQIFNSIVA